MSLMLSRQNCAEPWMAQAPWHQAGVGTGELQVLAVLLGILFFGREAQQPRRHHCPDRAEHSSPLQHSCGG